ncbi:MAG: segregation/condensation protein A, partial [Clostridiales bacterium]|nr:segregation/condensation protein A [Clostridiales bacterium]
CYKEEIDPSDVIGDTTLELLNKLFEEIIKRNANKIDPIRSNFGRIQKEEINFNEKVRKIQEYGIRHKKCSFKGLLENSNNKVEIIVTFLGILELIKMGRVTVVQDNIFDDIEVSFLADDIVAVESYQ